MAMRDDSEWLTLGQAARFLGVAQSTIQTAPQLPMRVSQTKTSFSGPTRCSRIQCSSW